MKVLCVVEHHSRYREGDPEVGKKMMILATRRLLPEDPPPLGPREISFILRTSC
jgi:hypothetical protein